jgi:peptidoglycan hydrolase-like protein with peptidoglycan-binding domain
VTVVAAVGLGLGTGASPAAAATFPGCSISTTQRQGATNDSVNCIEKALAAQGFRPAIVDRYYGWTTTSAVRRFQSARGLHVDGIVGPLTAMQLGIWGPPPLRSPLPGVVGCVHRTVTPTLDGLHVSRPTYYQKLVHVPEAGERGPLVVIGDSLTYATAERTARALRAGGWGPICVDGTVSRTVLFGTPSIPNGINAVSRLRTTHPLWSQPSVRWVVALGTNDVGFSGTSRPRADSYVENQLAAIGPTDMPVRWVNVHTARSAYWQLRELVFNDAIGPAGAVTVDWYGASVGQPWFLLDRVHLNAVGNQQRTSVVVSFSSEE